MAKTRETLCEEKYDMLVGRRYNPLYLKCIWGDSRIKFRISYAPSGRAKCKFCGKFIEKGSLRITKVVPNPFDAEHGFGDYDMNFHPQHFFQQQLKARKTTKVPISVKDFTGFKKLKQEDQKYIRKLLAKFLAERKIKNNSKRKSKKRTRSTRKSKSKKRRGYPS